MYQAPIVLATYIASEVLGEAETSGSVFSAATDSRASVGFNLP